MKSVFSQELLPVRKGTVPHLTNVTGNVATTDTDAVGKPSSASIDSVQSSSDTSNGLQFTSPLKTMETSEVIPETSESSHITALTSSSNQVPAGLRVPFSKTLSLPAPQAIHHVSFEDLPDPQIISKADDQPNTDLRDEHPVPAVEVATKSSDDNTVSSNTYRRTRATTHVDPLAIYEWYHGLLERDQAAYLVQAHAHGAYLVRKGNGVDRDYILTVNWAGAARHLPIAVKNHEYILGEKSFASLPTLLSFYRSHPFPTDLRRLHEKDALLRLGHHVPRSSSMLLNTIPEYKPRHFSDGMADVYPTASTLL